MDPGTASVPPPGEPDGVIVVAPLPGPGSDTLARVGRNSLVLLVSQSITWVLSAALILVVPRYFGPEAVGWITVAVSLWAMAGTAVGLGTSTLLTMEFARDGDAGRLVGPVLRIRAVTSVVAFAAVLGFAELAGYRSEVVTMVAIAGVTTALGTVADIAGSGLVGLERMADVGRADVVGKLASTATALGLLALTHNVFLVAASAMVMATVRGSMLFPALRRAAPLDFSATRASTMVVIRRASPFFVAGLTLVLYQQVDAVVISLLVEQRQLGWYGAADGVFSTLLFLPNILMASLLPAFAREHARDEAAARHLLGQSFDVLLLATLPLGLSIVVTAPAITRSLYGSKFSGATPVLAVYGVVLIFTALSILFGSYAAACGRQRLWNVVMGVAIVATIPLDLVLVPWTERRFDNGAIAGAVSYVIVESLMVVVAFAVLGRHLFTARRIRRTGLCLVAGSAQLAAGWPLRERSALGAGAAGLAIYGAGVIALRVPSPSERAMAGRVVHRVVHGVRSRLVRR